MMRIPYEWRIGWRYLRSVRVAWLPSFISVISILGVALGVAALIGVLSVMNGFEYELRQRILSITSHATLMGLEGRLDDWQRVRTTALENRAVRAAAPYIEDQGMLVNGTHVTGTMVRGIVPAEEGHVSSIAAHMTSGTLETLTPGSYHIVLGAALARELAVKVGDDVILIVAKGNSTPVGVMPRMRRFHVTGIFYAGMYEFDRGLALTAMADAARLYRLGDGVTGVRLSLDDLYRAPGVVRDVALALGGGYYVSDWTRRHANFFRSIQTTKTIMFYFFLLLVIVAAINVVSSLVMIVRRKRADIAILRTMGATPRSVLAVFVVHGALIGLLGTLAGVLAGIGIADQLEGFVHGLERVFNTHFMDPSVYFMSDLPARVEGGDVVRIAAIAFVLCCLASLYPAWRAARTEPAEALRHE